MFDVIEDLILKIVGVYGFHDFINYKLNIKIQIS